MLNVIMSTCTHGHAEHVAYAEYEHMHSHDVAREHVAHAEHEHMHSHDVARDHVAHAEHEHMHSHANMLVLAPTRALPAAPAHPQTSGDLRRDGGPHQPRLQPTAQTGTYEFKPGRGRGREIDRERDKEEGRHFGHARA